MHLVLDVNETLSDLAPIGDVLEAHGAPRALARAWFNGVLRDGFALSLHRQAPRFLDLAEQSARAVLWASPVSRDRVDDAVEDLITALKSLPVHPDVAPGLRALAAAGHTVSAFTNGSAASARDLLERAGVVRLVPRILSVEEGAVWKPHPEAYAEAAARLGEAPAGLTMVAVHPWDLDGAHRAGFRTAWLDRRREPWPTSFTAPDLRTPDLAHLASASPAASARAERPRD